VSYFCRAGFPAKKPAALVWEVVEVHSLRRVYRTVFGVQAILTIFALVIVPGALGITPESHVLRVGVGAAASCCFVPIAALCIVIRIRLEREPADRAILLRSIILAFVTAMRAPFAAT
jgi:hypothetical protein